MLEIEGRGFGETGERAVCLECVLDRGLREQVAGLLSESLCTFCGRESADQHSVAVDFEDFMPFVMDAIRFFYERSLNSLFWDDDFTPRCDSQEVARNICEGAVADDVMEAITEVISDDEWNEDPGVLRPDIALRGAWEAFQEKVKHETRFVFLSIPEERSDHPDEFTTTEILEKLMEIIYARGALVVLPVGHVFYRGRLIDNPDDHDQYSAENLGSPPSKKASASRMSPAGISMFYGCDDVETVVAEIGAHSTSRFAVIGEFETTRPLRMVNLADLPPALGIFSPEGRAEYFGTVFLNSFAEDLSAPISIDGGEHIDYVPTQVVTEYMRWLPGLSLDGLLFKSAQNGGRSSVVFCGPDACADSGRENEKTVLRLREGSVRAVRVMSVPVTL
ncbi:HEPN-associated N-terminal domain-containing protein [Nonomuraea sp. NPDC046570]|uniref:HEPN-associated N-terminal domain-containing protein n=1 Tax=Nonomuraea sp. NPDC046570 TaxID=3155255 RepID=UPI0033CC5004